ncbi:MAG: hypothetical protein J6X55_15970, partial [Victivallales bacterium]|nr:hypothetical protein [Victivallales bacterium]
LMPKIRGDIQANPKKYTNLLPNPDFEQISKKDTANPEMDWDGSVFSSWSFWREVKIGSYGCAPTAGVNGSKAAFMDGTGASCFATKIQPVKPGEIYYVSAMGMNTDAKDVPNVIIRWQNAKGQRTATSQDVKLFLRNPRPKEWGVFEGIAKVPEDAAQLLVQPGCANAKGRILFDNVRVYKIDMQ